MIDKNKNMIVNAIILLLPYKKRVLVSLLITLILTVLNSCMPILTRFLMDEGIVNLNIKIAIKFVLIIISIVLLKEVLNLFQNITHMDIKNTLELELQKKAMSKLLRMKMSSFTEDSFSKILNSVSYDITNMAQLADKSFLALIMEILKIVGGLIGLFLINYKLTFFILLLIPVKYIVIKQLTKQKDKMFIKFVEMIGKLGQWHGEMINGIQEIKLWNLYKEQEENYDTLLKSRMALDKRMQILDQINIGSDSLLQNIIFNLLYIVALTFMIKEQLTLGGLIAFTAYSSIVMQPITLLLAIEYQFSYITPSLHSYIDFMLKEGEAEGAPYIEMKNKVPSTIRFEGVDLAYNSKMTLEGVHLEFQKGEKIAFVGSNGSGKTSLLNLLLRFYTPTHGKILIDDVDINKIDIEKYRDLFTVMSQQVYLFNTSIKNNISMFREKTEEQIIAACEDNKIDAFIQFALDDLEGLQKIVGIKGNRLSGGERQKIAFIRTLLKPSSPILILDEATSNYDLESENIFNEIIGGCRKYEYIFVVTHRPEVLEKMDKIVVIDKGHIIWQGTYGNLPKEEKIMSILQNQEVRGGEVSNG